MTDKVRAKWWVLKSRDNTVGRGFRGLTEEFLGEVMERPCVYCGIRYEIPQKMVIDRIDGKKGYTNENIVSACTYCNVSKRNHSLEINRIKKLIEPTHH
jgi:MinD superfamily P-loop ATPase